MLQALLLRLDRLVADPTDAPGRRLQKILMVRGMILFLASGFSWGLIYFAAGEWLAAAIPAGYGLLSLGSLIGLVLTRRYRLVLASQLLLTLFLPFLLGLSLGGFHLSSGVIIWGLAAPLAALLFDEPRRFPLWFLAYLSLLVLSACLEPYLRHSNHFSPGLISAFYVLNIGMFASIVFLLFYYFMGEVNRLQNKTDSLLLNILPAKITALLKENSQIIADQHPEASILFADIVGFTPLAASLEPVALVRLLNEVFSHFDSQVEELGLEKIKTIGDCYMVAAGVPQPCADHAERLVRLALRLRDFVADQKIAGQRIAFRMGINSGPVVAGVIGRKKFIYDLWGDAVNVASRMESGGRGGMIQITATTYALIRDKFDCRALGQVHVKGKGPMETWEVLGPKTP